jgi:hypothetical protein
MMVNAHGRATDNGESMNQIKMFGAACAALALTGLAAPAMAQGGQVLPLATDSFAPYGPFGGWNVVVNTTRGSCMAERVTGTSVLQMGITEPALFGYLGVFTSEPTELQRGRVEQIEIMLGERRFVGEVTEAAGNIVGGFSGGYIVSRDPGLVEALSAASTMTATVGARAPIEIDLKGTAAAITAVQACNAAQAN